MTRPTGAFDGDNIYQDEASAGPPRLQSGGAQVKRVAIAMFVLAFAAGLIAALAGLSAWQAVALMWVPAMVIAFAWAIRIGRRPEVKQYQAEYKEWREQQLARGRSRWSVELEQVRTTMPEQRLKRRDLVILLLHLLLVLAPVGALFTLFGWLGGRW